MAGNVAELGGPSNRRAPYGRSIGFCVLLAALLAAGLISGSQAPVVVAVTTALTIGEVAALFTRAGGFVPTVIPVVTLNSLMTLGYLFWDDVRTEAVVSADLPVTQRELFAALLLTLSFTLALTCGTLLAGAKPVLRSAGVKLPVGLLVLAGYAVIVPYIYGRRGAILEGDYLSYSGPLWAVSVGTALVPAALLAFACALFQPGYRAAAGVGLASLFLMRFGASSRQMALIPGMLLLGRALSPTVRRSATVVSVTIAAVVTLVLAQLAITLRSNPAGVGILPLAKRLVSDPGTIFNQLDPASVFGNVLFSTPQVAKTAEKPISMHAFWVSVDPRPGSVSGFPQISAQLRLNVNTPFSGLGELGAQGLIVVGLYGAVVGLILGVLTRVLMRLRPDWRSVATVTLVALVTLFPITLLQYNLRTGSRLIWYAMFPLFLLYVLRLFTRSRIRNGGPRRAGGHSYDPVEARDVDAEVVDTCRRSQIDSGW